MLGLFGVNMPLLYGEKTTAFRRLQEHIMARSDDWSLFAWDLSVDSEKAGSHQRIWKPYHSLLAPSPRSFRYSRDVQRGFATQRISFELTNRGIMVLIHRSYNPEVVKKLLDSAVEHLDIGKDLPLGLTIPVGCFIRRNGFQRTGFGSPKSIEPSASRPFESCVLRLILDNGRWHRAGVTSHVDSNLATMQTGKHLFAYVDDYIRIYIHHDKQNADEAVQVVKTGVAEPHDSALMWLHIRPDRRDKWWSEWSRAEV